jgi:hypothetical protein
MTRIIISILLHISAATIQTQGNLQYRTVITPGGVTIVIINKNDEQITIQASETKVQLPVGKYRIDEWRMERTDEETNNWKLTGSNFDKRGIFYVHEGQEVKLLIGVFPVSRSGTG